MELLKERVTITISEKNPEECLHNSRTIRRTSDSFTEGQAGKSARGMPWHQEPKKDVTSCDKPGGTAHRC